jgi:hypothetical protein
MTQRFDLNSLEGRFVYDREDGEEWTRVEAKFFADGTELFTVERIFPIDWDNPHRVQVVDLAQEEREIVKGMVTQARDKGSLEHIERTVLMRDGRRIVFHPNLAQFRSAHK